MKKDREWLKHLGGNGGMGDYIDPLTAKALREAFPGLPPENPLFQDLKTAVVTAVRSGTYIRPSLALTDIVAGLEGELSAEKPKPLTPLAAMYKQYRDERAANPPAPNGYHRDL